MGLGSAPDPFLLSEYPPQAGTAGIGNSNTAGKTQQTSIFSSSTTTKVILIGGQSNMATAPSSITYTTVSAQSQNLSVYDGAIWSCSDPILGPSNATGVGLSSICARLMDQIIAQGKAGRAIGVPFAMGGTPFASWVPGNADNLFSRISTAILRCRARGLEPDFFIWGEGETDNTLGTASSAVTASINAMVDGIRAAPLSCTAPFYIGKYTMVGGVTSSAVQAGITASIDTVGRKIFAGFDADTNCTVAGGFRLADGTHLSNTGLTLSSTGWQGIILP